MNNIKRWIFIAALFTSFSVFGIEDSGHENEAAVFSGNMRSMKPEDHRALEGEHESKERAHDKKSHGDEHEESGPSHGQETSDVELSDEQRRMAEIETMIVTTSMVGQEIIAPGEVKLNAYRTTKVTPRVAAQVTQRHVRLGDLVAKGQSLVTLSSVEMAEAQGKLLEADVEWRRVKKLGRKVVSGKRFIATQVAQQQAIARARAFGMTDKQIDSLLKTGDASRATGEFELLAMQEGTVIRDDFVIGELIEPGHQLFQISDESSLWVEARLTPQEATSIELGALASINVNDTWLSGKVIQARHTLDEATRTLAIHIEVPNPNDQLHPGQFVSAAIEGGKKQAGLAVPIAAVLRSTDGDWQVFVEVVPGRFEPKEIEVVRTVGERMVINGLADGTTIVSKGAFFIQSEIAKGGFDIHNH